MKLGLTTGEAVNNTSLLQVSAELLPLGVWSLEEDGPDILLPTNN